MKEFKFDDITRTLQELQITYSVLGEPRNGLNFSSLRKIEKKGIYYLVNPNADLLKEIEDSVVIVGANDYINSSNTFIVVESPQLTFYRLSSILLHTEKPKGVHPTAIVHESARIHPTAYIGPYCVLEEVEVDEGVFLHSHVVLHQHVCLKENVIIESHSTIGATGVAWMWDEYGQRVRQPQTGGVRVESNVFLGAGTIIVRGSVNEDTIIGADSMLAPGCKIGHSVVIGPKCHLANNVAIGGSVKVGERSFIGSGAVLRPHVVLAKGTIVGAGAAVVSSTVRENTKIAGVPAKELTKGSEESPAGMPKPYMNR